MFLARVCVQKTAISELTLVGKSICKQAYIKRYIKNKNLAYHMDCWDYDSSRNREIISRCNNHRRRNRRQDIFSWNPQRKRELQINPHYLHMGRCRWSCKELKIKKCVFYELWLFGSDDRPQFIETENNFVCTRWFITFGDNFKKKSI